QILRNIGILQGIHLELDQAGIGGSVAGNLPFDSVQKRFLQQIGCRQQFQVVPYRGETGRQIVEQFGSVPANGIVTCQKAQVCIDSGGDRVVVSGSDVNITTQPTVVL